MSDAPLPEDTVDWLGPRYDDRCRLYPMRDCPGCVRTCARNGDALAVTPVFEMARLVGEAAMRPETVVLRDGVWGCWGCAEPARELPDMTPAMEAGNPRAHVYAVIEHEPSCPHYRERPS